MIQTQVMHQQENNDVLWTVGRCEDEQPVLCNMHGVGPTTSSDSIYHCLWWVYWLIIINWCISLICMGDLIGYLIGVTILVKRHIHYNQILLRNWWQHFRSRLNTCNIMHKKKYFYVHYSNFNKYNVTIHWVKLMLILMGQMMLHWSQFISIGFDFMWKCM